jgi:hypothetical protein
MHKLKLFLTMSLICFVVFGCKERDESAEIHTVLSATDIAYALGMNWWTVRLPSDLDPNDFVTVTYKHPDGSIESQGGSSNWQAGAIVKVMVWPSADGTRLRYSLLHEKNSLRGNLITKPGKSGTSLGFSKGKMVKVGDVLMKFSEKSCIATSDVRPDEIGLILHVDRTN